MRPAVNRSTSPSPSPSIAACALAVGLTCLSASAEPTDGSVACKALGDWVLPPAPTVARPDVVRELPRLCPEGQVPLPVGHRGPKGSPGKSEAALEDSTSVSAAVTYHYAGVFQFVTASGASAEWAEFQPTLATRDSHTLAEMSVESANGQQIVEVGWTVDVGVNGDALPHLFVFHWVDGKATCYDGCGWEQVSATRYPGMIVALTREPQQVIYRYFNLAWWVWYQSEWIGFFPVSLWDQDFSIAGLIQWFGEVAGLPSPKSQMGDGLLPSQMNSGFMTSLQVESGAGDSQPASLSPSVVTDPGAYDLDVTDAGFLFGGPGYNPAAECATCASLLANCGVLDDGCGNSLSCGTCVAPETCGGVTQMNVCLLPDGGMGGRPYSGIYADAGATDAGTLDAGSISTGNPHPNGGGCSSSGAGASLLVAALSLGLFARRRQVSNH
jgi:Neprosin